MKSQTFQYVEYNGGTYLRLVRQKTSKNTNSGFFKNETEALHFIDQNNQDKFSILGHIDEIRRYSSNSYEFLLYYPEFEEIVHWKQKISPLSKIESDLNSDTELLGVHLFTTKFINFRGILKSNNDNCYVDGDSEQLNFWKYPVGVYHEYEESGKMPGFALEPLLTLVYCYEFLMRVPTIHFSCRSNTFLLRLPIFGGFLLLYEK